MLNIDIESLIDDDQKNEKLNEEDMRSVVDYLRSRASDLIDEGDAPDYILDIIEEIINDLENEIGGGEVS